MSKRVFLFMTAGLVACSIFAVGATAVSAAEVTLRMKGGDFQVTGDLRSFDRSKYTISSKSLGTMSLDASRFDCIGGGCPKGNEIISAPAAGTGQTATVEGRISIAGSNTVGNQLMPAFVTAYGEAAGAKVTKIVGENPLDLDFRFTAADGREMGAVGLHRHGSSTAFTELEKGMTDIGMSSRPIKPEEVKKLQAAGFANAAAPGSEHVIGLDGLMVLVSQSNNTVSLPIDTIAKIFSGQIRDWSEVGQPAGKINVYSPSAQNGTFDTFESLVLKPRKLELTPDAKRTENHAEQSDWVAQDPLGIGFTGIAYQRNAKALNIETSCGLVSPPSIFSIKTEEYPLSRRLFLYTKGEPKSALARGILEFALSPKAQPIIKAADFIDQVPETIAYDAQAARFAQALNATAEDFDERLMAALMTDVKARERLSTTFRFQTGSFTLDNKALGDIARLRDVLAGGRFKGKSLILAGFADNVGNFRSNLNLADARARAVQNALGELGASAPQLSVKSYGELAPVSCNDTETDRQFNRRVEVWLEK